MSEEDAIPAGMVKAGEWLAKYELYRRGKRLDSAKSRRTSIDFHVLLKRGCWLSHDLESA